MVELVTDRSQVHVRRLKTLRAVGWKNMTDAQKAEYTGFAAKGAYNYTDLNRVETAVAELATIFGLTLTTKTDWGLWDIPTPSEMERYLSNVVAIRDACLEGVTFPTLPESMNGLTYEGANNIENVLELAYQYITGDTDDTSSVLGRGVLGKMILGKEIH